MNGLKAELEQRKYNDSLGYMYTMKRWLGERVWEAYEYETKAEMNTKLL